jgi:predicted ATP-binding protein involved in virulence
MAVQSISVKNLFGSFDYTIVLHKNPNVTLLTGANGSGKTVILQMVNELLNKSYHFSVLKRVPFESLEVVLDSGQSIRVTKELRASETTKYNRLTFRYTDVGTKISKKFHLDSHLSYTLEDIPGWFQRLKLFFLPPTEYIDNERPFHKPTLVFGEPTDDSHERILAVNLYAQQLTVVMEKELASYSERAQRLDSTFPIRMLEQTMERIPSDEELFQHFNAIKRKRTDLRKAGIFDHQADVHLPEVLSIEAGKRAVLFLYLQDVLEKLEYLEPLRKRISLFTDIINRRFLNKKLNIDRKKGFFFTTLDGAKIANECLSAGEQNLVILLYELMFKTVDGCLIMIDEPEMSLHRSWQQAFLADLELILQITNFDIIIATHSYDLTNGNEHLCHHLQEEKTVVAFSGQVEEVAMPSSVKS